MNPFPILFNAISKAPDEVEVSPLRIAGKPRHAKVNAKGKAGEPSVVTPASATVLVPEDWVDPLKDGMKREPGEDQDMWFIVRITNKGVKEATAIVEKPAAPAIILPGGAK